MRENNEIYFELFRDVERAIKLLGQAQSKAETMFLELNKRNSTQNEVRLHSNSYIE